MLAQSISAIQANEKKELIFSDNFEHDLDTLLWKSEIEPLPASTTSVTNGKLVLNTRGGVTVWLNILLKGNIQIEFSRKVIMNKNTNDRLSDFNQFWMAKDPKNANLFTRRGKFEEYDNLILYYVGMGGNTNTTTRFRKYMGNGERSLLKEYKDSSHLLNSNHEYQIKILVSGNTVNFYADNVCYFTYRDAAVLKEGYFGFRSTFSHQEIDNVKIYQLE